MILIGDRLRVAVGALEDAVVVRIRVAGGTDPVGPAVRSREPGVIEGCIRPLHGVVAGRAGGREMSCGMVRVIGT